MSKNSPLNEHQKEVKSMTIEIEPIDPLFFRDGRPFGGPGDHWADSFGFPLPSTIYGALLGKYISKNCGVEELEKLWKEKKKVDTDLEIEFVYFCPVTIRFSPATKEIKEISEIVYFPAPRDYVKEKKSGKFRALKMTEDKNWINTITSLKFIFLSPVKGEVETVDENMFLEDSFLDSYEEQEKISFNSFPFIFEPKMGIGLNKFRRAVEENKIYRVSFRRYENFENGVSHKLRIGVKFKGLNIPKEGILKLGGEGKSAKYQIAETEPEILSETIKLEGRGLLKFYLTTPVIFEKGWIPDFLKDENREWKGDLLLEKKDGEKVEINLSLKGAVIGKPLYVGGWDIVAGIPKPMFRAVPAGSVYLFEYKLSSPIEVKRVQKMLFNPSQTDLSEQFKKEGFGIGILINQSQ
ncbi:MAG: type III-B CRISPR module-associated protein Cmr3 [Campylobacterales bacterium]